MKNKRTALVAYLLALSAWIAPSATLAEGVVNIYSARKEALILPVLEIFRERTGIDFNLITGKADGLLKRIELEGKATPADVFITVDAGRLQRAKKAGVLRVIESEAIDAAVPDYLRDADKYWFALSQRARTIFYLRSNVKPEQLSTYEQLADPMWKGRLCVRSSGNIYNQSLVASMIEANGVEQTEQWARGLVANFARPPTGGDTDQLKSAAAGQCDIAIANTYYYGRLAASTKTENQEVANKLGVFWPNQGTGDRGVHVNVSGVGITKHARNYDNAMRLIQFLILPESQSWYAEVNQEYPVVSGVAASDVLSALGEFKADSLNLTKLGERNREAVELMDRAGWR